MGPGTVPSLLSPHQQQGLKLAPFGTLRLFLGHHEIHEVKQPRLQQTKLGCLISCSAIGFYPTWNLAPTNRLRASKTTTSEQSHSRTVRFQPNIQRSCPSALPIPCRRRHHEAQGDKQGDKQHDPAIGHDRRDPVIEQLRPVQLGRIGRREHHQDAGEKQKEKSRRIASTNIKK